VTAPSIARLFRFALVGTLGAAIHMGGFELVRRLTGLSPFACWLMSFLAAATAGWWLNRRFTFQAADDGANAGEWFRYLIVAAAGAAAHAAVFLWLTRLVRVFAEMPALAIIPGSLASLAVTYVGAAVFVFASARSRP
jgi:putative flippase GtrA